MLVSPDGQNSPTNSSGNKVVAKAESDEEVDKARDTGKDTGQGICPFECEYKVISVFINYIIICYYCSFMINLL